MQTAIIPRATITGIVASRADALARYGEAFDMIEGANQAARAAGPMAVMSLPGIHESGRNWPARDRAEFVEQMRKVIDKGVWSSLLHVTKLDMLMDKTARQQFREQLEVDPPEATEENCRATIESLLADADMIFKRGIATAFAKLDRRFRSHDGFKIGSRLVLEQMISADGWWNHHRHHDDTLFDIERAFRIMDGQPPHETREAGIIGAVRQAKIDAGLNCRAGQFEADGEYFRVKVFKNGNAHLWFKRDDLVERVNLLLADYYGAALGAAPDVADVKHASASTPAKNWGFFESPPAVVARLMDEAGIFRGMRDVLTLLEPSAGAGAIARAAQDAGCSVTCIEAFKPRYDALCEQGLSAVWTDFLEVTPHTLGQFDRVVMNPPFDGGRDIDHVMHALQFVKPGGVLVAVMSAGVEFREDRKAQDFRALVARYGSRFSDLPPCSFAESGTNVNAVTARIRVPAAS